MAKLDSSEIRIRIHERIRKKVSGTEARPAFACFAATSISMPRSWMMPRAARWRQPVRDVEAKGRSQERGNIAAAKAVGQIVAKRAIEKGISAVLFDRGGYIYHGRVKALADAAREAGLKF
jgi:large subunit ribosomal protein L18